MVRAAVMALAAVVLPIPISPMATNVSFSFFAWAAKSNPTLTAWVSSSSLIAASRSMLLVPLRTFLFSRLGLVRSQRRRQHRRPSSQHGEAAPAH